MEQTSHTAARQNDNSISQREGRRPGRGVMAALFIGVLIVLVAIAIFQYRSGGVHLDEEFAAQTYDGMTTYYLNSSNHSNISIIYLHDEASESVISDRTWRRLNRIANETDAEIITSDLSATSAVTDEEIYQILYRWYVPWQHSNASRRIYVMGDTPDEAIVEGFLDYLQEQGAALPSGQVSIDNMTEILEEQDTE